LSIVEWALEIGRQPRAFRSGFVVSQHGNLYL
jgi:hypothetical protein